MNYRILSRYYIEISDYQPWNMRQPSMELIVKFLQFYLKLNNLFVR